MRLDVIKFMKGKKVGTDIDPRKYHHSLQIISEIQHRMMLSRLTGKKALDDD